LKLLFSVVSSSLLGVLNRNSKIFFLLVVSVAFCPVVVTRCRVTVSRFPTGARAVLSFYLLFACVCCKNFFIFVRSNGKGVALVRKKHG
jgi:hypothetical protein